MGRYLLLSLEKKKKNPSIFSGLFCSGSSLGVSGVHPGLDTRSAGLTYKDNRTHSYSRVRANKSNQLTENFILSIRSAPCFCPGRGRSNVVLPRSSCQSEVEKLALLQASVRGTPRSRRARLCTLNNVGGGAFPQRIVLCERD